MYFCLIFFLNTSNPLHNIAVQKFQNTLSKLNRILILENSSRTAERTQNDCNKERRTPLITRLENRKQYTDLVYYTMNRTRRNGEHDILRDIQISKSCFSQCRYCVYCHRSHLNLVKTLQDSVASCRLESLSKFPKLH